MSQDLREVIEEGTEAVVTVAGVTTGEEAEATGMVKVDIEAEGEATGTQKGATEAEGEATTNTEGEEEKMGDGIEVQSKSTLTS